MTTLRCLNGAQVLLLAGAHQLSVDSEGKTPLDYATLLEEGAALVELLQQPPLSPTSTTTSERPLYASIY